MMGNGSYAQGRPIFALRESLEYQTKGSTARRKFGRPYMDNKISFFDLNIASIIHEKLVSAFQFTFIYVPKSSTTPVAYSAGKLRENERICEIEVCP